MTDRPPGAGGLWSIVLRGGAGGPVGRFVERWLGYAKPKQYCAFVGGRSLFQHAVDRAAILSRPDQIIALVTEEGRREAAEQLDGRGDVMVLTEPRQAGTVSQLYLSLAYVTARDPYSTIALYPSDHFFYPEHRFVASVQRAAAAAEWLPDRLMLLAVQPERLEVDYTWVLPGEKLAWPSMGPVNGVQRLLYRPMAAEADKALADGALWHTSVLVGKSELLWQMGWECFPDVMVRFDELRGAIGTSEEAAVLHRLYRDMPNHDVVEQLLTNQAKRAAVVEMNGVLWCEWNTPERITHTLRRIGRQPAFPLTCLSKPFAPIALGRSDDMVVNF